MSLKHMPGCVIKSRRRARRVRSEIKTAEITRLFSCAGGFFGGVGLFRAAGQGEGKEGRGEEGRASTL